MDDAHAVLAYAFDESRTLGIDPSRIALGGASSGGGLAAGLALLSRDRGDYRACFQWLIYPMLDDRGITSSSRSVVDPRVWNERSNRLAWQAYLSGLEGRDVPPYAAPARAQNLAGLPPCFIATGDLDLFVDENIDYARRLLQAQVPTELHVYPGAIHGFDLFAPGSAVSRRFTRDRDAALLRAFTR